MKLYLRSSNSDRIVIFTFFSFMFSNVTSAASKEEIDIEVKGAVGKFQEEVTGGKEFLERLKVFLSFLTLLKLVSGSAAR